MYWSVEEEDVPAWLTFSFTQGSCSGGESDTVTVGIAQTYWNEAKDGSFENLHQATITINGEDSNGNDAEDSPLTLQVDWYVNVVTESVDSQAISRSLTLENTEQFPLYHIRPFVPGFSSWQEEQDGEENYYSRAQSAGTDCIGFVQRSLSYDGAPYINDENALHHDLKSYPWCWKYDYSSDGGMRSYMDKRDYFYYAGDTAVPPKVIEITPSANLNKITDYLDEEPEKIIPGDIMYYWANGYHVGIVDRVEYGDSDTRSGIQLENIKIIEATWDDAPIIGNVINSRNLNEYWNEKNRHYRIGRLIQE